MRSAYGAVLFTLMLGSTAMADLEIPPRLDMPDVRPKPREWDLLLRGYIGREENIALNPKTSGDKAVSETFGYAFDGVYRILNTPEWTLGGELIGEGSAYSGDSGIPGPGSDANDFSYWSYTPKFFGDFRYTGFGLGQHVAMALIYHYEQGANADAIGLNSQTVHFVYGIAPIPQYQQLNFDLHFIFGMDTYQDNGNNPVRTSRNAMRSGVELWVNLDSKTGVRNTLVKVGFLKNDAEGLDYDYQRFYVDLCYEWHVWGPLWIEWEFGSANGTYENFSGSGGAVRTRGDQRETRYGFKLLWVVDNHWALDAWYTHREFQSENENFDATADSYGVGLTYRF